MSQISRDDVAHLARLARLSLTDGELDSFAGQLDAILAHVGQIQAVDVTGVEATDNPLVRRATSDGGAGSAQRSGDTALANVTRPDTVVPSLPQGEALAAAPNAVDGRFAVPRILGESE